MSRFQGVLTVVRQSLQAGRAEQALAALQRALQRDASDPELNGAMAAVQARLGQTQRAAYFAGRAARAGSDKPHLLQELGLVLAQAGQTDEVLRALEAPAGLDGGHAGVAAGIACLLRAAGRFAEAAHRLERALERGPQSPALALTAINDWIEGGQGPAAAGLAVRMSDRFPDSLELAGLRAYFANYSDREQDVPALHRRFGEMLQSTVAARTRGYAGPRDPARRLRVGLLSPDLRFSAVAFFIEPFFVHRDRLAFEVFGYSVALKEDEVSARLRALADGWMHQPKWTDEQIAEAVERDGIDVLIDLAGLTGYSRLGVMAMRPAPVSATYLGYPNTTGLTSIDRRIVDALTDPPGSEDQSTEELARMEGCLVCYHPWEDCPPVNLGRSGPITFGSFNNLLKFNSRVARVWARVLAAVDGSRLVIKAPQLGDPGARAEVLRFFETAGVEPSRIQLLHPVPGMREHLEAYSAIDIALDTFPYCGTTTTCEALLMGVPVVTLRGHAHRGRVGSSLLNAAGLADLVAPDEDGYVALAARLAGNREALSQSRASLRPGLLASPLCDGPAWCRRFENVLRSAWASYCAGNERGTQHEG